MIHCCRVERHNSGHRRGRSAIIAQFVRVEIEDDDLTGGPFLRALQAKLAEQCPGWTLCHSFPAHGEH